VFASPNPRLNDSVGQALLPALGGTGYGEGKKSEEQREEQIGFSGQSEKSAKIVVEKSGRNHGQNHS
jgi:hypothetical protein